ncbi:DUF481 domain-containing protein [Xanthomarina sp. F1114]|uniref:DUF481 domain-containing protein n=1 Tax=Xanthomarina sp. F1114 TaxID=2996019 RepID=UPI00225DE844|nr:DUF481 domain-containing protein [Xanthomarina sp. F1114]MCX7546377.1 DUF481 domain-containing protein [Xanthomarina sp. F1114]
MNRLAPYCFLFYLFLIIPFNKVLAQKTDTIYHVNKNILTGELKNLAYGVFTWKMDGMGTISLEEIKVSTIISQKQFEIKLQNDAIYFGTLGASDSSGTVFIITKTDKILVHIKDIVELYPIKNSFWLRFSGNLSLGFNYSKGSDIGSLAFSGDINYRKKKAYFEVEWDQNNTYQADTLGSRKADVSIAWQRLLRNGWSTQLAVAFSQNSELGIKERWGVNLMGLKDLSYNNWNRLYAGTGINLTHEIPYGSTTEQNDIAGIFQVVWRVYKYKTPKLWVDSDISYLPYFTDSGRHRAVFNLNPKINLFSDNFKVGLKFYYTYDSKPPADAASTNDYGVNFQLSYSLH